MSKMLMSSFKEIQQEMKQERSWKRLMDHRKKLDEEWEPDSQSLQDITQQRLEELSYALINAGTQEEKS